MNVISDVYTGVYRTPSGRWGAQFCYNGVVRELARLRCGCSLLHTHMHWADVGALTTVGFRVSGRGRGFQFFGGF